MIWISGLLLKIKQKKKLQFFSQKNYKNAIKKKLQILGISKYFFSKFFYQKK